MAHPLDTPGAPSAAPSPAPLSLAVLATAGLGVGELALRALDGPASARQSMLAATLVTLGVHALLGLVLGLVGRRTPARGRAGIVGLCVAVVAVLALADVQMRHYSKPALRALEMVSAVGVGVILFWLVRWLVDRVRLLGLGAPWGALTAVGAVASLLSGTGSGNATEPAQGPSVLLVTIDTLRADHLAIHGGSAVTPTIDALAKEGVVFEDAVAQSIFTGPSHISILSGLLPAQHGVTENMRQVGRAVPTLAETLSGLGYDTGAFVSGAPVTQAGCGLLERFDGYDDDFNELRAIPRAAFGVTLGRASKHLLAGLGFSFEEYWRKAPEVTDAALDWIAERERPYFAWVHYYDPHLPYTPPERLWPERTASYDGPDYPNWYHLSPTDRTELIGNDRAVEHLADLYDAEIALVDENLARLVESAREAAGEGGLWIVVTSDHGESFGEHGVWYTRELYDASLSVPLVLVPPGGLAQSRRAPEQVRLIDVAPTLLEALGHAGAFETEGVSLLSALEGPLTEPPGVSVSTLVPTSSEPFRRPMFAIRRDGWKAILRLASWANTELRWDEEERELYDLTTDPGETRNLAEERADLWERLRSEAGELRVAPPQGALSEEQLRVLRNLGYAGH